MAKIAFRNPNTYLVLTVDAALFAAAYYLAYWLRFESTENVFFTFFYSSVYYVVALKIVVFALFGLQSGMWRYTSVIDLGNILKASLTSLVLIMAGLIYLYYPQFVGKFSRSVFVIDALLASAFIAFFRISIRIFYSQTGSIPELARSLLSSVPLINFGFEKPSGIVTLIYGADDRGEHLLRSFISQPGSAPRHMNVIGFIDDEPGRK